MGPNQTYKLLHSKRNNQQNEKTIYTLGENICKWCDDNGLISEMYNSSYNSITKKQTTQSKNGQKT